MKKIVFGFLLALILVSCANGSQDSIDSNGAADNTVIWSINDGGVTKEVACIEKTQDDVKSKSVVYREKNADGTGMLFGIAQIEVGDSKIYKGSIQLKGMKEFSNDAYNHYSITAGNSIVMGNAVRGVENENGNYLFMVMGSLSEAQVTYMKNANTLKVSIWKDDHIDEHAIDVNYEFILALLKNL